MPGINRALSENRLLAKAAAILDTPCIFISHISVDKTAAVALGEYILKHAGIDVYLDVEDARLQQAITSNDPAGITEFIELGISRSTHLMCLVSAETVKSWWVPYELGFAKKAGKHLATLKLKGDIQLPAYLEIGEVIRGTESLNKYLAKIGQTLQKSSSRILTESLIPHHSTQHPLDRHLDWKL